MSLHHAERAPSPRKGRKPAAGNFLYIGASDLVPEVNKAHSLKTNLLHFVVFAAGLGLLFALAVVGDH